MFEKAELGLPREGSSVAGIQVKEFDGGRGVEFEVSGDYVIMETGYHAFAFDRAILKHALRRLLGDAIDVGLP